MKQSRWSKTISTLHGTIRIVLVLAVVVCFTRRADAGGDVWTSHGPFVPESFASARVLAADPQMPTTLYAGDNIRADCGADLRKSIDGGDSWQNVLDDIDCVTSIVVSPVDSRVVHVAVENGFHTSRDGGYTWETQALPDPSADSTSSLALDSRNPTTLYATTRTRCDSTFDCSGRLLKSVDDGRTWNPIAAYDTAANAVVVGPDSAVYVAGGADYDDPLGEPRPGFLARSADGGSTWLDINVAPGAFVLQLALGRSGGRLHATLSLGIYGSDDGGVSWHREPLDVPVDQLVVDPFESRYVYAIANRFRGTMYVGDLSYSADSGDSWTRLIGPPDLIDAPTSDQPLLVAPTQPVTLYVGYLQEVYRTTDRGSTWSPSGAGLGTTVVAQLAISPFADDLYATAGALYRSDDQAVTWTQHGEPVEFGADVAFDPKRKGTVYVTAIDGVRKSVDGGRTWRMINLGLPFEGGALGLASGDLAIDPKTPEDLYLAIGELYSSSDGGESWTRRQEGLEDVDVRAVLAVDGMVYAGSLNGVYGSTDVGATWHSLGVERAGIQFVTSLTGDPRESGRVYVTSFEGLARSLDAGATWANLTAGTLLDGQACTAVAVSPVNSEDLYVGTYDGVFRSRDGGATWLPFSAGIAQNVITDLIVEPRDAGVVYAATQFSGVYVIDQSDVAGHGSHSHGGGCAMGDTRPSPEALLFLLLVVVMPVLRFQGHPLVVINAIVAVRSSSHTT